MSVIVRVDVITNTLCQWTKVGSADAVAMVKDANDGTYLDPPTILGTSSSCWWTLPAPVSPGIQYVYKRTRLVYRVKQGVQPALATRVLFQVGNPSKIKFWYTGKKSSFTTLYSSWSSNLIVNNEFLAVMYEPTTGAYNEMQLAELYVETEWNELPTCSVDGPAAILNDTLRPDIPVTYSDAEGDPCKYYKMWIYPSSVYSLGGFQPGVSGGYTWYSGKVSTSGLPPTIQPEINLPDGFTYKAYLQVYQAESETEKSGVATGPAFQINQTFGIQPPQLGVFASGEQTIALVSSSVNLLTENAWSAEYDSSDWVAYTPANATISQQNVPSPGALTTGLKAVRAAITTAGVNGFRSNQVSVANPGTTYQLEGSFYSTVATNVQCSITWYNLAAAVISTSTGPSAALAANTWQTVKFTSLPVAPAGAVSARLNFFTAASSVAIGTNLYLDNIKFSPNAQVGVAGTRGGLIGDKTIYLYRSLDGGASYQQVAPGLIVDPYAQTGVIYDPAPPYNVAIKYTAVLTAALPQNPQDFWTSDKSVDSTVTHLYTAFTGSKVWTVRDAEDYDSATNMFVEVLSPNPWQKRSDEQMARFAGLGRKYPLIIADNLVRGWEINGLTFEFSDLYSGVGQGRVDFDKFMAIRDQQHIFSLTRRVPGLAAGSEAWYFRITSDIIVTETNTSPILYQVQMNVTEVSMPLATELVF
jgi:hypothetical protein